MNNVKILKAVHKQFGLFWSFGPMAVVLTPEGFGVTTIKQATMLGIPFAVEEDFSAYIADQKSSETTKNEQDDNSLRLVPGEKYLVKYPKGILPEFTGVLGKNALRINEDEDNTYLVFMLPCNTIVAVPDNSDVVQITPVTEDQPKDSRLEGLRDFFVSKGASKDLLESHDGQLLLKLILTTGLSKP